LEKQGANTPYDDLVTWFLNESKFEILNGISEKEYQKKLLSIEPLNQLLKKYHPGTLKEDVCFLNEFVLWGLVQFKKLSKVEYSEGIEIQDPYGDYIRNI